MKIRDGRGATWERRAYSLFVLIEPPDDPDRPGRINAASYETLNEIYGPVEIIYEHELP